MACKFLPIYAGVLTDLILCREGQLLQVSKCNGHVMSRGQHFTVLPPSTSSYILFSASLVNSWSVYKGVPLGPEHSNSLGEIWFEENSILWWWYVCICIQNIIYVYYTRSGFYSEGNSVTFGKCKHLCHSHPVRWGDIIISGSSLFPFTSQCPSALAAIILMLVLVFKKGTKLHVSPCLATPL